MMSLLKPLLADTKDPKSNTSLSPVTASNLDIGTLTSTGGTFSNLANIL